MPILGGIAAKIAASAIFGRAKNFVKAVPREVWIGLAVVITLVAAVWWHNSHAEAQLKLAYEQGFADRDKQLDEALIAMEDEAEAWKEKYETASTALAATERALHDQTLRSNAARADALRVRGPGAAKACPRPSDSSGLPTAAGDGGTTDQQPNAEGRGMPADQWATVPWAWLVTRAETCDADRDEVIRWRNWYPAQKELYDNSVSDLQKKANR